MFSKSLDKLTVLLFDYVLHMLLVSSIRIIKRVILCINKS